MNEESGGPVFLAASGSRAIPELQLIWYQCFIQYPSNPGFGNVLLTEPQQDYLYDYYQRWVVPCIMLNGYALAQAPTREEFHNDWAGWNPYYSIEQGMGTEQEFETLVTRCGGVYADLDVPEAIGF